MGDPARELAHGLHFLSLLELIFKRDPRAHVARDHQLGPHPLKFDGAGVDLHEERRAVLGAVAPRAGSLRHRSLRCQESQKLFTVFRWPDVENRQGEKLAPGISVDFLRRGVHREKAQGVGVVNPQWLRVIFK